MERQVSLLGQVLAQQPVGVFVCAALPGTVGITEVDLHIRGHTEGLVLGHLVSPIPRQRSAQRRGEFTNVPAQCGDDHRRLFTGYLDQRCEARMPFHQCHDVTVLCAADEIALPVTWDRSVLDLRWSFPNRNSLDDLTLCMSALTRVLRAAYAALGPEVPNQLFFQYSTRLNKQATVNGLVRHAQALVLGILAFQPSVVTLKPATLDGLRRDCFTL